MFRGFEWCETELTLAAGRPLFQRGGPLECHSVSSCGDPWRGLRGRYARTDATATTLRRYSRLRRTRLRGRLAGVGDWLEWVFRRRPTCAVPSLRGIPCTRVLRLRLLRQCRSHLPHRFVRTGGPGGTHLNLRTSGTTSECLSPY